ncbi:MAG: TCP-1/cpn60 chaperonin family protein [Bacteroidota bacterium]
MSNTILREVVSGDEARQRLLKGLNKSCDIVSSTMSYRGSNNLFEQIGGLPHLTMDGWDSLQQLYWDDPLDHIASEILKEGCKKQFELVGDNTTLTCVLVQAFFTHSLEELKKGSSSIEIKKRIDESVLKVIEYIDSIAVPVTEELMFDIAKTSAHGDEEIAKIVQEAFIKAGEHGIVSHKRSFTDETYIEHIAGNPVDSGYLNEGFINVNETQSVVFDNPLVLCSLINFQTANEVIPFLEYASSQSRPLVIISNMTHDISNMILENVVKHKYPFSIIRPPYQGRKNRETMKDLALILGCEVLEGISRTNYDGKEQLYLGSCERIESGKKDTVITADKNIDKDKIEGKILDLAALIKLQTEESEKNYIRERISKITGGISTVFVGGVTHSEVEEKVARIDDAIFAVRASKDGGVVAGGGIALLSACTEIGDLDEVISLTLLSPINKILSNASAKWDNVENCKYPIGYDVKDYKEVNMFEAGIIDTAKGVKTALINAASASNNLLRTDNVVTLKRFAHDTK